MREMTVSWEESFAFNSPRFPQRAKWADRLAFELPAATPHNDRKMLLKLRITTRIGFGKIGDSTSRMKALSFKTSASNRYILHSGSRDVPKRWAKRMVASRPTDS
jgi:hypothetical protein